MMFVLFRKLLRDLRWALLIVMLLLGAFQCLWAKITERLTQEILPALTASMPAKELLAIVFRGPGQIFQTLIGGESIDLLRFSDVLTIGYVHPLTQTILCIWAVGRAAAALAGEIDRGTMELLLAQPISRVRVVAAHFLVDCATIPLLCLSMWLGNVAGSWFWPSPVLTHGRGGTFDLLSFLPALANVAALLFAVSGYTMWLSAAGRYRSRVLGIAVLITLLQFLLNVIGQFWDVMAPWRMVTVFYYYQPQQIMLQRWWSVDLGRLWHWAQPVPINAIAVLVAVGILGYGMALVTFSQRDLPAPL